VSTSDDEDDPKDVEALLAEFKRDSEQLVRPEDAQAHYDLASAYREMGLVDDALQEYRLAAQAPALACQAGLEMGQIHAQRGETALAIEAWTAALSAPEREPTMTRKLCELLARHGRSMA